MIRRIAILLCALALAGAACSDPAGDESSTTTSAPAGTTTTVPSGPQILEGVPDEPQPDPLEESRDAHDGFLGPQEALDLFSAVYGPVPGADDERFDAGPGDGTMAMRNVFRLFDELTPDQQEAVLAASGSPGASIGPNAVLASQAALGGVESQVAALESELAGLLGRPLGLTLEVVTGHTFSADDVLADAAPLGGGVPFRAPYDTCRLRVSADGATANTLAHELFHCFQFTFSTSSTPDWIEEGQAEWVGARVGGVDAGSSESWSAWATGQLGSLFAKDYDAVGFYWVIEQAGANPWTVMPSMFGKSNVAAVEATGLSGADAARWMGTTTARDDLSPIGLSSAWTIAAGDAPAPGVRALIRVSEDAPFERTRSLAPFTDTSALDFHLDGDVVTLDVQAEAGAFEFLEKSFTPFDGSFFGRFCIREGGCSCDSEGEEELEEGSDRLFVAAASASGGSASIRVTMEEYDDEFADGSWTGELIATVISTDFDGAQGVSDPLGAPFEMTVADRKVVEGSYSVAMYQTIDAGDVSAEGVGMIGGYITGCSFAPRLVATGFSFEGTITDEDGTRPFVFSIPFDDTGAAPPVWQFDESDDDDRASGMLVTTPYLEYMRGVGVGVNDVQIRFVATRSG
ncbi:MAG TPA: hypothetical protein VK960_06340 [Acidimicrobiia bacterium]|nr:hypothetical protein [Acidimicrobiia bacterium]